MKIRHVYLGLCVPGFLLPYVQLIPWLAAHGLNLPLFFNELFATRIGAFFGMDVIVSALVLFVFIWLEGRRLATVLAGVSLGFPLFLYLRQREIDTGLPDQKSRGPG